MTEQDEILIRNTVIAPAQQEFDIALKLAVEKKDLRLPQAEDYLISYIFNYGQTVDREIKDKGIDDIISG